MEVPVHPFEELFIIEDAMRRDTAAPHFLGLVFRDSF